MCLCARARPGAVRGLICLVVAHIDYQRQAGSAWSDMLGVHADLLGVNAVPACMCAGEHSAISGASWQADGALLTLTASKDLDAGEVLRVVIPQSAGLRLPLERQVCPCPRVLWVTLLRCPCASLRSDKYELSASCGKLHLKAEA